jgi:hypothetical protein
MKLLICLLLFVVPLYAQSTAEVTGVTSSGDPIATYRDRKYIMLKAEQVAELNRKLDRLDQLEAALPICEKLNTDYQARVTTAVQQGEGWKRLFDSEHELRIATQQFVKRPSRFTSWMDKPLAKLLITFVPPIITAVRQ